LSGFPKKSKKYFRGTLKFRKTLPLEDLDVAEKKYFVPQAARFFEKKSGWQPHKIRFSRAFFAHEHLLGKNAQVHYPSGSCPDFDRGMQSAG